MKISYCTNVKGRLWQLKQTLPENIQKTIAGEIEIVVLDYFSDDGLGEYIKETYPEQLADGRLSYYRMTQDRPYDCSHAKNVAHRLGKGTILFNLDADNYIGTTVDELSSLDLHEVLVRNRKFTSSKDGTPGRIGIHRSAFYMLNGYDERFLGQGCQDGNLMQRALMHGLRFKYSEDETRPIQNSKRDSLKYCSDGNCVAKNQKLTFELKVNPDGFGRASLIDINNQPLELS